MTCIVGLAHAGRVWLAGDSAAVGDDQMDLRADPKVFSRDGWVLGAAGGARIRQVMEYGMELPSVDPCASADEHLYRLAENLRTALHDAGSLDNKDGHDEMDAAALVGWNGNLWHLGGDFAYCRYDRPFAAIGSGQAYALGALEALWSSAASTLSHDPPETVIEPLLFEALRVSAFFNTSVSEPFTIVSTWGHT